MNRRTVVAAPPADRARPGSFRSAPPHPAIAAPALTWHSFAMRLYQFLIRVSALTLRLRRAIKPDPVLSERLTPPAPPEGQAPLIWLHGASNGELTAARPILDALRRRLPGLRLVITANSVSGRDLTRRWGLPGTEIRLAPHDDPATTARFLDATRPAALIVVENELWPNRLTLAAERGIPVFLLSARLSERSARRWGYVAGLARGLMATITWLAPQDEGSRARFAALGLPAGRMGPVMVLKSAAAATVAVADDLPFAHAQTVLAASTHEGEEEIVLDAFARAHNANPALHLILAPRHPRRRDEVEAAIRASGLAFATRSRGAEPDVATPVYLADTLGEMDRWYAGAGITFVGGSLTDRGGHTPFEPAAHGSAILTGPHVSNATPAYAALFAAEAAVRVEDAATLADAIAALADPARQQAQARRAREALSDFGADAAIDAFLTALSGATGIAAFAPEGADDAIHD